MLDGVWGAAAVVAIVLGVMVAIVLWLDAVIAMLRESCWPYGEVCPTCGRHLGGRSS